MLQSLKRNNNHTCAVQAVLGVAKCKSVKPSLHLRCTDFKCPVEGLLSPEPLQPDTDNKS